MNKNTFFAIKSRSIFDWRFNGDAGNGGGGKFGGWGGVKFRIFTFTYKAQFWSYENVVNMFLVRFELEKHLRTLSEHFEQNPRFFVDLKLLHGVKQGSSRNPYIFRS